MFVLTQYLISRTDKIYIYIYIFHFFIHLSPVLRLLSYQLPMQQPSILFPHHNSLPLKLIYHIIICLVDTDFTYLSRYGVVLPCRNIFDYFPICVWQWLGINGSFMLLGLKIVELKVKHNNKMSLEKKKYNLPWKMASFSPMCKWTFCGTFFLW